MWSEAQTAFILHRRAYRETSLLVDAFVQHIGKVSFVAKGVRSSGKNSKKALLQPFQQLSISLYGRHELKNLRQVEALQPMIPLQSTALFCGMYINEMLTRLLQPELDCSELFTSYHEVLQALTQTTEFEPLLREFELVLLQELGYGIDFAYEQQSGEPIQADCMYYYEPEQGLMPLPQGQSGLPGIALLEIAQCHWSSGALKVAKYINRRALQPLLGDKPLKSRELFMYR